MLLLLFLVGFLGLFSPLCFSGKGQLEKGKRDGWLLLFQRGNFNWGIFYHMHVYFSLFVNALTQFKRILHQLQWDLASVSFQPPSYHFSCIRQLGETPHKDYTLSKIRASLLNQRNPLCNNSGFTSILPFFTLH